MSMRKQFFLLTLLLVGLVGVMFFCQLRLDVALGSVASAHRGRLESIRLAQELRQSSDDLTRLARTYVITGDPRWEQQYFEVLDIRNGKRARPERYDQIYWDFRAADNAEPRGRGETVPLQQLMVQAGFTDAEFAKLKQAQANSDDLVRTETVAMNMVKGLYDAGDGRFTKKAPPDFEKARAMMHDADYHRFKAKIMKPVDEFLMLLDERTLGKIGDAERHAGHWKTALHIATGLLAVVFSVALYAVFRRIAAGLGQGVSVAQRVAEGDLTCAKQVARGDEIGQLLNALHSMQQGLVRLVDGVRTGAEELSLASDEIAHGNIDLSSRTELQASSLQQTSSSMQQLSTTIKHNADSSRSASTLAERASDLAAKGGDAVDQVVSTMTQIQHASASIANIIGVIDGIAFQTNILALNAAVEAARAGEQGRGFAVVAAEVRSLAKRSADAAKEIKELIDDSVLKVDAGSAVVANAGQTMGEVVREVRKVSELIGDISAACTEQSNGVSEMSGTMTHLEESTQQNAALVEQMAAASDGLRQQAHSLAAAVAGFRVSAGASTSRSLVAA